MRRLGTWLILFSVGCHALPPVSVERSASPLGQPPGARTVAGEAEVGPESQAEFSTAVDPVGDHLNLAADFLEEGDEPSACSCLAQYVAVHPEHALVRIYFAELLLRLHRIHAARRELESSDVVAQEEGKSAHPHLVRCHSRLTRIAEAEDDAYAEHMHRGIGLYYLAQERTILPEPDGKLSTEGLLCRAAGELQLAASLRPEEARPCWYLYAVWTRLAQRQPARRWLRAAAAAAPFTFLTPAEKRHLFLAWEREEMRRDHQSSTFRDAGGSERCRCCLRSRAMRSAAACR